MEVLVSLKIVPDDQDIQTTADGKLDFSIAKPVISSYDQNAIAAAAQIEGANVSAITVGPASINDTKQRKNILARGPKQLFMVADDTFQDADANVTAKAIVAGAQKAGNFDLIVFGAGSADTYAQQVGIQVGELLGWPVVNGVSKITAGEGSITVERTTETEVQTIDVPLPAVVAVTSDIVEPRIPSMRDILKAGKLPVTEWTAADLGSDTTKAIDIIETVAPAPADRKREVFDASVDGDIDKFAAALAEALR